MASIVRYVTPFDFGARGDGLTDDTGAILLMFASGFKHGHFPKGMFLASSIAIPSGWRVSGDNATLIRKRTINGGDADADNGSPIITSIGADVSIVGMMFDGQEPTAKRTMTGIALSFSGISYRAAIVTGPQAHNLCVKDCSFTGIHGGSLMVSDSNNIQVVGCAWEDCGFEPIFATSSDGTHHGILFSDCTIENLHGLETDPTSSIHGDVAIFNKYSHVRVSNLTVHDVDSGLKTQTVSDIVIENCTFDTITFKNFGAVHLQNDTKNALVYGCTVRNAGLGMTLGTSGVDGTANNQIVRNCIFDTIDARTLGATTFSVADGVQIVPLATGLSDAAYFEVSHCAFRNVLRYPILCDGQGGTKRAHLFNNTIIAGTSPAPAAQTSAIRYNVDSSDTYHAVVENNVIVGYGETGTNGFGAVRFSRTGSASLFGSIVMRGNRVEAGAAATLTTSPILKGVAGQPEVAISGTPASKLLDMRVVIDSIAGGTDVGQATFRWSQDGGHTWTRGVTTDDTPAIALGSTGFSIAFTSGTYATTHSWSWQAWVDMRALQFDGVANGALDGIIENNVFEGSTKGSQAATLLAFGPNIIRGAHNLTVGRNVGRASSGVTDIRPCFHRAGDIHYDSSLAPPLPVFSDGAKWRDATGAVSAPATNLFADPSAFNTGTWSRQFLTATADFDTDPSGGGEADLVVETVDNGTHQFTQNPTRAAADSTWRIRVRAYGSDGTSATGRDRIEFTANNLGIKVDFDLTAVTSTTVTGIIISKAITLIGDDWYLLEVVFADDGSHAIVVRLGNGSSFSYVGDVTLGAEFWLAELFQ